MDTYYQIIDRDSSTVSPLWKGIHLASLCIAIIGGCGAAYTVGRAIEYFGNNCILFANISFLDPSKNDSLPSQPFNLLLDIPKNLKPIDLPNSNWGPTYQCHFCQFTPVVSMITAIIWCTLFLTCSRGGAGFVGNEIYRPWRIVYPAMFFATIFTGLMLLSTIQLREGMDFFCEQFKDIFNSTGCVNSINDYTLSFYIERRGLIIRLKAGVVLSFICFIGWLLQLSSLIMRVVCIADFQLLRITVTHDEAEEVIHVVNPVYKDHKAPLATISELSNDSTPSRRSNKKNEKNSSLLSMRRKALPPTDQKSAWSSNKALPGLKEKEKTLLPTNGNFSSQKQNSDHHRISFDYIPLESDKEKLSTENAGKKGRDENISMFMLNGQPNPLNENSNSNRSVSPT